MENFVNMKSPYTGGRVKEIFTTEVMEYQGHEYTVHVRYYQCEDTGEKFTTTEQDQEWYDELHELAKRGCCNAAENAVVAEGMHDYDISHPRPNNM